MKIAFISDIHGNAVALEAVLEDINKRKIDKIIVLGDICFRGPEPKRALQLVRSLQTEVLKGNADEWVVRGINEGEVPSQALEIMRKEREWIYSKLNEEEINYLNSLPLQQTFSIGDYSINAFHATPSSLFDIVKPDDSDAIISKLIGDSQEDLYVYGHIHLPFIRFIDGKCVANLGSVGVPFDGVPKASYLIASSQEDEFNVSIQRVSYDIEKVVTQYKELDYPNKEFMINLIKTASL